MTDMTESFPQILNNKTDKMNRILIADDHPLVRQALRNLIETQPNMAVIAEASNGREAVTFTRQFLPDVIIMDIGMPILNGLEATRQIKAQFPTVAILVLTVHTDKEHIIGILEAGAAGYITKIALCKDIVYAIQAIAAGESVLSPTILQEILKFVVPIGLDTQPSIDVSLSTQELFILRLAAKGMSNKVIGAQMKLSENTIKSYMAIIFSKLNVSSRTEAVMSGFKAGFISLNDLE
jgi:DNA-binding NarL/FixJ family response regulator